MYSTYRGRYIERDRGGEMHTLMDITLDHHTHDGLLASSDLLGHDGSDLGLVAVVLEGVPMRAVDHQALTHALLQQLSLGLGDARRVVVGALGAAAQDDEAVLVAHGAYNSHDTRLCYRQEVMWVPHGADGVDGHTQRPVRAVLEPHGEAQSAGQLAVQLRLRGARADGAYAGQVSEELRRDRVEHLAGDGHAAGRQVDEQLAADAQALVDLEAVVDVRVVDEALPPDSGARLLQVRAHDDQQLAAVLLLQRQQPVAVLERGRGVVDRARADDHQQPVVGVGAGHDGHGLVAALEDRLLGGRRLGDLMLEEVWWGQGVVAADWRGRVSV